MRTAKTVALIILVVVFIAIIGWNVAPDWFRSGLVDYLRESVFARPVQTYDRWRVRRAGYNYDSILTKCGHAAEGAVSLMEAVTMRDAEYVVEEPQVKIKGDKVVADVPTEITRGSVVIPTQHHCEYDVSSGAVIRSETLRVKR